MMKQKIIVLVALLLAAQNSLAMFADEQIKQNVEQAQQTLDTLTNQKPLRLWIQVRTEQQRQLLQHIADWLKPVSLVKIEPIQVVKEGPKKSQLRFFSSRDKEEAEDLFKKLQKIFPQMELKDLSEQYGAMSWMETGHIELWLAPELKKFTPPPLPARITPPEPVAPAAPPVIKPR